MLSVSQQAKAAYITAPDYSTWTTNGLNIYNSLGGNVSIGTTSANYKLTVDGDVNFTGNLLNNGSAFIGSRWGLNGSSIYYNNGNVGIGTTNPASIFNVARTTSGTSATLTVKPSGTGAGVYQDLDFEHWHWGASPRTLAKIRSIMRGFGDGELSFWTSSASTAHERLTITKDGNVGIGTTTPSSKLYLNGGNLTVNNGSIAVIDVKGGHIGGLNSTPTNDDHAVPLRYLKNNYDYWRFATPNKVYVASTTYNVGIGTTNPTSKLTVAGDTSISSGDLLVSGENDKKISLTHSVQDIFTASNNYILLGRDVGIGTIDWNANLSINGGITSSYLTGTSNRCLYVTPEGYISAKTTDCGSAESTGLWNHIATQNIQLGNYWLSGDGGNEGVFVKSDGNVGIGTSSPVLKLHVNGDVALPNAGKIRFDNGIGPYIGESGNGLAFYAGGSGSVQAISVDGNGKTRVGAAWFDSGLVGNVGIGTTTPSSKLYLNGGNLTVNNGPGVVLDLSGGLIGGLGSTPTQGDHAVPKSYVDNNFISTSSAISSTYWSLSSNKLYPLNNSWNIGIGTTTPAQKLDVLGVINASSGFRVNNAVATAGQYLRGNGTNFVASTIQVSDVPALNQNTTGYSSLLMSEDNRTVSPSDLAANRLKFGFTSYNNNTSSPWADFIHLRSYQDVTGGKDNLLVFNKANFGMRLYQQAYGSSSGYSSYKDILLSDNSPAINYVTKYTSAGDTVSVGKSIIYDNGTNVGINTTTPATKLHVYGNGTYSAFFTNGRVGIGTTTPSTFLDIDGGPGVVLDLSGGLIGGLGSTPTQNDHAVPLGFLMNNFVSTTSSVTSAYWKLNGSNLYASTTAWNIGIGTTNPGASLHVDSGTDGLVAIFSNTGMPNGLKLGHDLFGGEYGLYDGATDDLIVGKSVEDTDLVLLGQNVAYANNYTKRVGIGITSPDSKLHLYDDTSGPILTMSGLDTNYRGLKIGNTSNAEQWFTGNNASNNFVVRRSGTTDYLTIASSTGNVGIGTTAPSYPLEVKGNILSYNGTAGSQALLGAVTRYPGLWFGTNTAAPSVTNYTFMGNNTDSIFNAPGGKIYFRTSNTNRMAMSNAGGLSLGSTYYTTDPGANNIIIEGNVGIGTTAPGSRLHVQQTSVDTNIDNSSNYPLRIRNTSWTGNDITGIEFWNGGNKTVPTSRIVSRMAGNGGSGETLYFQTQQYSVTNPNPNQPTTRMTINNYGNVGINTVTPATKLHVYGNGTYSAFFTNGRVGIGTTTPSTFLDIDGGPGVVLDLSGGLIGGLGSTPTQNDHAVPLGFLMNNFVSTTSSVTSAYWKLNGSNLYASTTDWNVGIGTTDPEASLHVYSGADSLIANFSNVYMPNGLKLGYDLYGGEYGLYDGATDELIVGKAIEDSDLVLLGQNVAYANNYTKRVGIGTTSPDSKLHIYDASSGPILTMSGLDTNYRGTTIKNTSNTEQWFTGNNASNNFVVRRSGTTDYLTIASSTGNVGVGTTGPQAKLHIQGNIATPHSVTFNHYEAWGSNATRSYLSKSWASTPGDYLYLGSTGNTSNTAQTAMLLTSSEGVKFGRGTDTVNGVFATEWMRINTSGNVGIGISSPGTKLDLVNNNAYGNASSAYATTLLNSTIKIGNVNTGTALLSGISLDANSAWIQIQHSNNSVRNLLINPLGGYVGIGATTPSRLLQVGPVSLGASSDTSANIVSSGGVIIADSRYLSFSNTYATHGRIRYYGSGANEAKLEINGYYGLNFLTRENTSSMVILGNNGFVGIGTTTPIVRLSVIPPVGGQDTISVNGGLIGGLDLTPINDDHAVSKSYVDNHFSSNDYWGLNNDDLYARSTNYNVGIGTTAPDPGYKLHVVGSAKISGGLDFGGTLTASAANITGKLTVQTIDPLYQIKGIKYSTFAPSFVGGVKEEISGRLKVAKKVGEEYQAVIDFTREKVGSDLWVWRRVIDFSADKVEALITPYGSFANVYYYISGESIVFRSDRPTDISYRLTGRRFDWRNWPTKATDQTEKPSFIVD